MSADSRKSTPSALVVGILVVLLIGLIAGAFFLFGSPAKPVASTTTSQVKTTTTVSSTAKAVPKVLGVHTVIKRDTLWWISDKWYKDPILWPSIYEINKSLIEDPDLIFPGQKFDIPAMIGSKGKLAPEDYTLLAQGYLEAYRVYQKKGKKDAQDYRTVGQNYQKKADKVSK